MITADYYAMFAFRRWATAVSYMAKGYFACINNVLDVVGGNEALHYDVH